MASFLNGTGTWSPALCYYWSMPVYHRGCKREPEIQLTEGRSLECTAFISAALLVSEFKENWDVLAFWQLCGGKIILAKTCRELPGILLGKLKELHVHFSLIYFLQKNGEKNLSSQSEVVIFAREKARLGEENLLYASRADDSEESGIWSTCKWIKIKRNPFFFFFFKKFW